MDSDWVLTVKVHVRNMLEHDCGRQEVLDLIAEEGLMSVIIGWTDPEKDVELLDVQPEGKSASNE